MSTAESTLAVGSRERAVLVRRPGPGDRRVRPPGPGADHQPVAARTASSTLSTDRAAGISLRLRADRGRRAGRPDGHRARARLRVRRPRVFGTSEVHTYARRRPRAGRAGGGRGHRAGPPGVPRRAGQVRRGGAGRRAVGRARRWSPSRGSPRTSPRTTPARTADGPDRNGATVQPRPTARPGEAAGAVRGRRRFGGSGRRRRRRRRRPRRRRAAAARGASGERLRGLVTGQDPGGVTVILAPTSLVEAAAAGARTGRRRHRRGRPRPACGRPRGAFGKVPSQRAAADPGARIRRA